VLQGNVVEAARRARVSHIVKLSMLGASLDSPIGLARWHAETERQIEASAIPFTHVRPHSFMQNTLLFAPTIRAEGKFYAPMKDAHISMVDVRDVACVCAAVLTSPGPHVGKVYEVTGPQALSYGDVAQMLTLSTGRRVQYVDLPFEAARDAMLSAGTPEWLVGDMLKMYEGFVAGAGSYVTHVVAEVGKKDPRPFALFAREFAAYFGAPEAPSPSLAGQSGSKRPGSA
jgi:uncharacterized protein YbjT (DUF2867 family)